MSDGSESNFPTLVSLIGDLLMPLEFGLGLLIGMELGKMIMECVEEIKEERRQEAARQ